MPKNASIKANTVDETKLPPHLRNRSISKSITIYKEPSASKDKYPASTTIDIGDLLYLDIDGYLKKASNDGHNAEYIALSSGFQNELIEVNSNGIIEKTLSYNNNTIIFLGISGGYTDESPTTTDSISQPIGIYNNNIIKYNISDFYIKE